MHKVNENTSDNLLEWKKACRGEDDDKQRHERESVLIPFPDVVQKLK
jgi:hypothetical protein